MNQDWVRPVSFLTAFLFAIHPFNVESVAWMSAKRQEIQKIGVQVDATAMVGGSFSGSY